MSKPENRTCADEAYLEKYLLEQLDETEESSVQAHLGACPTCQRALERVAADASVWDAVREQGERPAAAERDDVDEGRLERLLACLGPTDDPAMLGRIDQYEVCGVIGQGATGIVLKALEPALHRFVAIKVLSPMFSGSGAARKRFARESRAVAAVSHEHVVPIYAVSEFRDLPYLVMQYVPGVSLLERIEKDGALETCEVARIGLQVARGLAAAHAQGIVHRDVKPANVLLEETVDRAMVTDFGLARVADEATMTRTGTLAGTPQYMSPEQAKGTGVDPRSDLFSLGSLMYAAATAKAPFAADSVYGVIHRVCNQSPRPIREINPRIDPWLVDFIDRLMAKEPAGRFASAGAVADVLEAELAHLQHPTGVAEPPREWAPEHATRAEGGSAGGGGRRRVRWGWAAVGAALVIGGAAWAFVVDRDRSTTPSGPHPQGAAPVVRADERPIVVPPLVGLDTAAITWTRNEDAWSKHAAVAFDQRIEHAIPVEGATALEIDADCADIVVRPADTRAVTLSVMRRVVADHRRRAEDVLALHSIGVTRDGGVLRVRGRYQRREREGSNDAIATAFAKDGAVVVNGEPVSAAGIAAQARVKRVLIKVGVPRGVAPVIRTLAGDVSVGALRGPVAIEAARGDVELARVEGDLRLRIGRGDVRATAGVHGALDVDVGTGEARFRDVTGSVTAVSRGGRLTLEDVRGAVNVDAHGGTTSLATCRAGVDVMANGGRVFASGLGASARIRCSGGWVRLGENPGSVNVHTSGSDLRIDDVDGPLRVHCASGALTLNLSKSPASDVRLRTRDGGMRVNWVAGVNARVKATHAVPRGDIDLAEPSAARSAGDVVARGGIGTGGKTLLLGATTGDITFRRIDRGTDATKGLGGSGLEDVGRTFRGLGGSGAGGAIAERSARAVAKTSGPPRAGALATVTLPGEDVMDGYTLYLPVSHDTHRGTYGVLVYLQGGYGVGGAVGAINDWGLPRLIRDEHDLSSERNRLLLDSLIVVSPHIQRGDYHDHPDVVRRILQDVFAKYKADPSRVYLSGLSRGGHGCWGLAARMPETFAAIVPIGGKPQPIRDYASFADLPVWVVHNRGDTTIDYAPTEAAVRRIERESGVQFLRIAEPVPPGDAFLARRHLFTQPFVDGHDAWTDLYTSVAFYRWLLKQRRPRKV